ncbi:hypothetical protein GCM10022252_75010 [Streptosporangium oxazolinicum]|uniref:Uncharacterized protein n=1 Tax=Streptosporangium oxazolinicum TaxID=909287 RepID=A0ABP8BKG8_9ACTN
MSSPDTPGSLPCTFYIVPFLPGARRTLRRILLTAKAHRLDTVVEHDHGLLFRMVVVTATGRAADLRRFQRRVGRALNKREAQQSSSFLARLILRGAR